MRILYMMYKYIRLELKTSAIVSQLLFNRIFVINFNSFSVSTEIWRLEARFSCCEYIGLYNWQYRERTDFIGLSYPFRHYTIGENLTPG